MTVLVTGATGTVGSRLVGLMRTEEMPVRVFVRDPDKAVRLLGSDVELAVGDFADRGTIEIALKDVDKLFLACANDPRQVELEGNVIEAAAHSDVGHVVKLSALGAEVGCRLSFWDWQGRIEEHLLRSGLPATILRPHNYMSGLLAAAGSVRAGGTIFGTAADARIPMVDPEDVAAAAKAALTEPGHEGHVYSLTGPEAVTFSEVAAELSDVLGRPIAYVDLPEEAAMEGLKAAGLPDWVVSNLITLFQIFREDEPRISDDVRKLTGREPRRLGDFLRNHKAAFEGGPGSSHAVGEGG